MSEPIPVWKGSVRRIFSGRNLLYFVGAGYIPGGVLLAAASWHYTKGPYAIGLRYPYGGLLEAWQVTSAFAFIAFGLLFLAAVHAAARLRSRLLWGAALAAFVLMWFPHMFIGITFFLADPTLASLQMWVPALPFILVWMSASAAGFVLTWREMGELE